MCHCFQSGCRGIASGSFWLNTSPHLTLSAGTLSATVALCGAELKSLRHGDTEFIWHGDRRWWPYSAPLLFPIIGRLRDGQIVHDGRVLHIPPHGIARDCCFTVIEASRSSAELGLRALPEILAIYPFDFELRVRFVLTAGCLAQEVRIANHGATAMPASFGFHPGFSSPAISLQGATHYVEFEHAEHGEVFRVDTAGCLVPGTAALDMSGARLALDSSLFGNGALVFQSTRSRSLIFGDQHGPFIELGWANCPQLGIWSLPGAPFVCFEPWHGYPSPAGFDGALVDKPGGFVLQPGQTRTFGLTISPRRS